MEKLIQITEFDLLGKLPDPFLFNDGSRVKAAADWPKRREEIYDSAITLQYGTMPPEPEFVEVFPLYRGGKGKLNCFQIRTGRKEKPVQFTMTVILPKEGEGPYPAVITGDQCFPYAYDKEYINAFIDHDIALVLFNRTELVPDVNNYPERLGQLYDTYPEYTFGALGAWAWGYSRCVDALEQIGEGIVDMSCIAFTGHSRGGKTAALAGALDERAAIVNPNATCAGACGCYRLHLKALTEDGKEERSETLKDMNQNFPFWLGEGMKAFDDREEELPFDAHFLKAMVAPRVLFVSEAASDIWSNPVGSWLTSEAAKEVYKLFDKEENLLWYFRSGYHYQNYEDLGQLVNIIRHVKYGEPLNDKFYQLPFEAAEAVEAYDWKCPEK